MSLEAALRFVGQARSDDDLKAKVRSSAAAGDLAALVRIGAAAGLHFTADELRAAHAHDWRMRWACYQAKGPFAEAVVALDEPL